jgi:hypothetical protein
VATAKKEALLARRFFRSDGRAVPLGTQMFQDLIGVGAALALDLQGWNCGVVVT